MRKLESTIAQFVNDLLQTIGEATVDDLRELFAAAPRSEKPFEVPEAAPVLSSPPTRLIPPPRAARSGGRAPDAAPRRAFGSRFTISSGPSLPPGVAEITDPESLLSLGGPSEGAGSSASAFSHRSNGVPASDGTASSFVVPVRIPTRVRARALLDIGEVRERAAPTEAHIERHPEPEGESPASGIRPRERVRLSDNETLARVSNSGVVIRRKKRA